VPVCATVAETIFSFHYVLIRGFRLKFVGAFGSRRVVEASDKVTLGLPAPPSIATNLKGPVFGLWLILARSYECRTVC